MITWLLNHITLAGFNLVNSRIDAYRILHHKNIAHGINLIAYSIIVAFFCWLQSMSIMEIILFAMGAFFNRQLSFDIPLNLRRGLPWDYQSADNPPMALMDRIERWAFGNLQGKYIAGIYLVGFILFTIKEAFFL